MEENIILPKKTIIVTIQTPEFYDFDVSLAELKELTTTAGGEIVEVFIQKRNSIHPKSVLGEGKLKEIADFCSAYEIELAIFDRELSPTQINYLSETLNCDIFDRTMLILNIFSQRARSAEGKLQVELAHLTYMLPRLKGSYLGLSGLGGNSGMGATRGAGETKLELDKRLIRKKLQFLKSELAETDKRRGELRNRRQKDNIKSVVIAGYTNSGKSTLLNTLTDAEVLSQDMLFATLDPTSKSLLLPNGKEVMLIDTVGFIRRLPHNLVEAFKSTLEEVIYADLVLLLVDISDPDSTEHINVCKNIIKELGYEGKILTVFNKIDKSPFATETTESLKISAKNGLGIDELLQKISSLVFGEKIMVTMHIPYAKSSQYYNIIQNYKIIDNKTDDLGYIIKLEIDKNERQKFDEFCIEG